MVQNLSKENFISNRTFIKGMRVDRFRSLHNVGFEIGSNLTMISGINAVGKSSILGLLAQICSFSNSYYPDDSSEKGYRIDPSPKNFKTIYNKSFESKFRDHFKISEHYDTPDNGYLTHFKINDAEERDIIEANLKGTTRKKSKGEGKQLRLVLRKEYSISNTSRNITLPTIYLSLARLTPFVKRNSNVVSGILDKDEEKIFIEFSNEVFHPLLNNPQISSNDDTKIASTVLTGDNYNIESASTGEDNLGQILSAIISFIRLEKNWPNYKGGLLLIDELDASLFPKAQIGLLKLFKKVAQRHKIQIVFTTHSPAIISQMLNFKNEASKNQRTKNTIGINFLTNNTGTIKNQTTLSMDNIISYLNVRSIDSEENRRRIHCYCEDKEAYVFLEGLLERKQISKVELMKSITLGSGNISDLISRKIPEFSELSVIVLDGDKKALSSKNALKFPSPLPPDQLMFKLLSDEPAGSDYWKEGVWDYLLFLNDDKANEIFNKIKFDEDKGIYTFKESVNEGADKKLRQYFKEWFNQNKKILEKATFNPIKQIWAKQHTQEVERFKKEFDNAYDYAYSKFNYLS